MASFPPPSLTLLLHLSFLILSLSFPTAEASRSSYIVSIDRMAKPDEFSSHETWYSSLITSAMLPKKANSQAFNDDQERDTHTKPGGPIQTMLSEQAKAQTLNFTTTSESMQTSAHITGISKPSGLTQTSDYTGDTSDSMAIANANILHVYDTVFHGFAAKLSKEEAMEIGSSPGVLGVFPDGIKHVHTTRTPSFLGLDVATGLWPSSDFGADVIIGVLDTGIWPESPSFNDFGLGPVPPSWKGTCQESKDFPSKLCNKKIVGARYFLSGNEAMNGPINETTESRSARDTDGHGTHTASTAAGVCVEKAGLFGFAMGMASGIAPKARIAVYKVCWAMGCSDSDILAGFDTAVSDGVDVISLSVGGPISELEIDAIAIGAFGAVAHGVFVSASAGNLGPVPISVTNLAPWITTVGASTLDRSFPADIIIGGANRTSWPGVSLYSGPSLPRSVLFPLVDASTIALKSGGNASVTNQEESDALFCISGSLDPKLAYGKIVLCEGGVNTRTAKGAEVRRAGGVGMILVNSDYGGEGLVADPHVLPAVTVGSSSGTAISNYVYSNPNPVGSLMFHGTELGVKPAPIVASFSSRGPGQFVPQILKPDIIAPGVNVLAAWTAVSSPSGLTQDPRKSEFNIISGTSMSCPHVSGIAALLRGQHRDWSPAAIRSALMTTASILDNVGLPISDEASGKFTSPFDVGAGHVIPEKAMDPGLVYDIQPRDYVDFLCALNYSLPSIHVITRTPSFCHPIANANSLNYPSFSAFLNLSQEEGLVSTFNRTLINVGPSPYVTYNATVWPPRGVRLIVNPPVLTFTSLGERLAFTLTVSGRRLPTFLPEDSHAFGFLVWADSYGHVVRSPIAITWQQ